MGFTAKSVILDIADGWGGTYLALRSVDFYSGGSIIANLPTTNFLAYKTSCLGDPTYSVENAFDTSKPKTGTLTENEWHANTSQLTNQRVICVFNSPVEFDSIIINNSHNAGALPERGSKNVKVYISTDAITSVVYGEVIANSALLFDGVFNEHTASDVEDGQTIALLEQSKSGGKIGVFFKGGRVQTKTFSGTVTLSGAPAVREILVYLERDPETVFHTTSESDGTWSITINMAYNDTARIVCVGADGENSAIFDHLTYEG